MKERFVLLVMILAVPTLAFIVSSGLLWKYESDWQEALAKQFPDTPAERRIALTLQVVCHDPKMRRDMSDGCSTIDTRNWMRDGAIATAAAGVGWLLVIAIAGALARGSRKLLLHVFKPGLYLTNALLVLLIAAHGVLGVTAFYLGEAALIGRVHILAIGAIGVGALAGVIVVAQTSFSLIHAVTSNVLGRSLAESDGPDLWRHVRDLAKRVGTAPPSNIVIGLEANFFVTEAPVQTLDRALEGRTLFVSLPLARIFSREEFSAVVGHELGHFKGEDTVFSQKFFPIYRGTQDAIQGLASMGESGAASVALIPAIAILSFFFEQFSVSESRISREREIGADSVGASITSKRTMATALVKVAAFAPYWPAMRQEMVKALRDGKTFENISDVFARVAVNEAKPELLAGVEDRRLAHPTDTHPPLSLRLEQLGVEVGQIASEALAVVPAQPAITLVANYEERERDLNNVEHYLLARSLGLLPEPESQPKSSA